MANPRRIITPFAQDGARTEIPESVGRVSNSATWTGGFPPVTMVSRAAGGLAPMGQDFNGVFYDLSSNIHHLQSGGVYSFDADFAAAIGGYAKGALVYNANKDILYQSLSDGNNSALNITTAWKIVWRSSLVADVDGKINISSIAQSTGTSTSLVMSQKATTDAIVSIRNTASLTANGWIQDKATGIITQWGTVDYATQPPENDVTVPFVIPFPSQCYNVSMTRKVIANVSGEENDGGMLLVSATVNSFVANRARFSGSNAGLRGFTWQAIGR